MAGSGEVKGAFDSANGNLRGVAQYLMGSPASSEEPELRLITELLDVAEPLLQLWRGVSGVDGATRGGAAIGAQLNEVRGMLFRTGHKLPANGAGTNIEAHLHGAANTFDALINLLSQATGPAARRAPILKKEASSTHQTARHRFALALQAPDTAVDLVRNAANHPGRVNATRRLHRAAVDMARGVEAWAR